jgi:hypothetical protein
MVLAHVQAPLGAWLSPFLPEETIEGADLTQEQKSRSRNSGFLEFLKTKLSDYFGVYQIGEV